MDIKKKFTFRAADEQEKQKWFNLFSGKIEEYLMDHVEEKVAQSSAQLRTPSVTKQKKSPKYSKHQPRSPKSTEPKTTSSPQNPKRGKTVSPPFLFLGKTDT